MTTPFSTAAWQAHLPIYQRILDLPFNRELADGSLAPSRFRHYMIQDAHYLEGFARALSLASARGWHADHVVHFAKAAEVAIIVERSLHADYFVRFGVTPEAFAATEPTPVCDHYVSYLLRTCALDDFEVGLAALLPCFWIYREVGRHIHARAAASNPYRAWIDTYAGPDFEKAVDDVIAIVDTVAEAASPRTRERMSTAFRQASRLEWLFWDSAWREAGWPV